MVDRGTRLYRRRHGQHQLGCWQQAAQGGWERGIKSFLREEGGGGRALLCLGERRQDIRDLLKIISIRDDIRDLMEHLHPLYRHLLSIGDDISNLLEML